MRRTTNKLSQIEEKIGEMRKTIFSILDELMSAITNVKKSVVT